MATFFDLPDEPAPVASDEVFSGRGDLVGCERKCTIQSILSLYGPSVPLVVGLGSSTSRISHGHAELVSGSVTVDAATVTDNSLIFISIRKPNGGAGVLDTNTRDIGASFTITSSDPTDGVIVAWMMIEPAA